MYCILQTLWYIMTEKQECKYWHWACSRVSLWVLSANFEVTASACTEVTEEMKIRVCRWKVEALWYDETCYKYPCSPWRASNNCNQQWLPETVGVHVCHLGRFKEQRTWMAKNTFLWGWCADDVANATYSKSMEHSSSYPKQDVQTCACDTDDKSHPQFSFDSVTFSNARVVYILCNETHRYFPVLFLPLFLCLKLFLDPVVVF